MNLSSPEAHWWRSGGNSSQKEKGTGPMQRGHSLKVKKTNSSKKVSSETKSQKHSSEQCGGSCPFTLDSVLGRKPKAVLGRRNLRAKTLTVEWRCFVGKPSEEARRGSAKSSRTSVHSIQPSTLQTKTGARWSTTRASKTTVLQRWTAQNRHSFSQ